MTTTSKPPLFMIGSLALVIAQGCVAHRTDAAAPSSQPHASGTINDQYHQVLTTHSEQHGLPVAMHASAWVRLDDGHIERFRGQALSPLAWWQRFPFDIASDALWPGTMMCSAEVQWQKLETAPLDRETLTQAAVAAGYGGRAQHTHVTPSHASSATQAQP